MILTKGAHQIAKFQTFECSGETSPSLYVDRLSWKYIKFQLKKYKGVMSHDTEEWCKILRKNDLFQKWHQFGEFWSEHSKVSKICTFFGPFREKYITFDLKEYRGVIFHDIEESCKIWRKADLWFEKWHEEFGKFSSEHLKLSKLVLSWAPFLQSRKCMC